MKCLVAGCDGAIVVGNSRGHDVAGCDRCHRCVSISALLNEIDHHREPRPAPPSNAAVSAWFREVATLEVQHREHLRVNLTADQCLEVARVVDAGISMFSCSPGDGAPVESEHLTVIHVNQRIIRANEKTGARTPPLTVKQEDRNRYAQEVRIDGPSRVVYRPDKPLRGGATVWLETEAALTLVGEQGGPDR